MSFLFIHNGGVVCLPGFVEMIREPSKHQTVLDVCCSSSSS